MTTEEPRGGSGTATHGTRDGHGGGGGWAPSALAGLAQGRTRAPLREVEVIEPGVQTTVQDHPGRTGMQSMGFFPSGPVDSFAFRMANLLVGNAPGSAGLEIPLGRFSVRFGFPGRAALCGAEGAGPTMDGAPVPLWETFPVRSGSVLSCGAAKGPGFRLYLAVGGGIDVPPVLGSRSVHTLSGIGGLDGRPLLAGDVLPIGEESRESEETPDRESSDREGPGRESSDRESGESHGSRETGEPLLRLPQSLRPTYHTHWELDVVRGPHADPEFLTSAGWREFTSQTWRVGLGTDRLGVKLNAHAFAWARPDGAVAGGHPSNVLDNSYPVGGVTLIGDVPTILGPDGLTSGGYTVIATVAHAALWKLGQLRPGQDTVRFREVDLAEADALAEHAEFALHRRRLERLGPAPRAERTGVPGPF